ncbi:MAG TPA: serine/threonine-protein kinase, partial [Acidimicrobiales bacterium]|nr:serine/threonine-protein kinase [Acidimicrobiales bacterium]
MLAPGHVIDQRYCVVGLVGRGGMAEVFRATDTVTAGPVALKVLRAHEPSCADRFRAEAEALARLHHPGLVRLLAAGTHDGVPYLVLDLADGPSLADRLAAGPLGLEGAIAVGDQVADALAHAHRLGVVHRDVKPSNILGVAGGRWCVADFGIARVAGEPSLTTTGLVVGSPPYVAPEQVEGRPAGPAADVYALGLVVIECLTGERCYPGGQLEAALARLHRQPAIPAVAPTWLRDVLAAMTARDPLRRPSSAAVADAFRDRTAEPVVAATAEVPTVVYRPAPPRPATARPSGTRTRRARPAPHGRRRRPGRHRAGALAATATAAALAMSLGLWAVDDDRPAATRPAPATAPAPLARVGPTVAGVDAQATTGATSADPLPADAAEPAPAPAATDEPGGDDDGSGSGAGRAGTDTGPDGGSDTGPGSDNGSSGNGSSGNGSSGNGNS